ncbi:MAG: DUF4270 family protein [Bacteroidota bacterium]
MINLFRGSILIPLILLSLYACENNPFTLTVGEEFVEATTKVFIVDTLDIQLATLRRDSIATSGTGSMLAGSCSDSELGQITALGYFQIGIPDSYSLEDDEILDSITMILQYDDYYYGDTTLGMSYQVHQLSESLELGDNSFFYNNTATEYFLKPCGTIDFKPRPVKNGQLRINLNNALGREILTYLNGEMSESQSDNDFLSYFKGFVIVPVEGEGNCILSFGVADTCLSIKIYTHETALFTQTKEYELPLINSDLQYNRISCDWNNNPELATLNEDQTIPAGEMDDAAYVQSGVGLYTQISIPGLPLILELRNSILIEALLYLEPVKWSNLAQNAMEELRLYEAQANGKIGSSVLGGDGNGLSPEFSLDELYDEDTYLVFDITSSLNSIISDNYLDEDFCYYVGYTSGTWANTLHRVVMGAGHRQNDNLKLKLTFFHYDE